MPEMTISRDEGEAMDREGRITELIHTETAAHLAAMLVDTEAQLAEARAENERLKTQLAEVTQSRDAWHEEGLKWAQNSDFWREKYEALAGQGGSHD